jgi:hypothetical protein
MASQNKRLSTSLSTHPQQWQYHHPTNTMSSSAEHTSSNQYYHKPRAGKKVLPMTETNGMEASTPFFTLARH